MKKKINNTIMIKIDLNEHTLEYVREWDGADTFSLDPNGKQEVDKFVYDLKKTNEYFEAEDTLQNFTEHLTSERYTK